MFPRGIIIVELSRLLGEQGDAANSSATAEVSEDEKSGVD